MEARRYGRRDYSSPEDIRATSSCRNPNSCRVPAGLDPAEAVSLVLNYTTAYQLIRSHREIAQRRKRADSRSRRRSRNRRAATRLACRAENVRHRVQSRSTIWWPRSAAFPSIIEREDFAKRAAGVNAVLRSDRRPQLAAFLSRARQRRPLCRLWNVGGHRRRHAAQDARRCEFRLARLGGSPSRKIRALVQHHDRKEEASRMVPRRPLQFLAMLQEKSICPVIAARLPLREAARAHELLENAAVTGKIVLMCQE